MTELPKADLFHLSTLVCLLSLFVTTTQPLCQCNCTASCESTAEQCLPATGGHFDDKTGGNKLEELPVSGRILSMTNLLETGKLKKVIMNHKSKFKKARLLNEHQPVITLQYLACNYCKLQHLRMFAPFNKAFPNLNTLKLKGNYLVEVPPAYLPLTLNFLHLEENLLKEISRRTVDLSNHREIRTLRIEHNPTNKVLPRTH